MNFLYPQFLFGLLALSIPIIVHLFNFRKTRKIQFSNNLFLKQVKEVSTAKRKLKHYLTLAARLLFVLFLVLAFAQPFIPGIKASLKNDQVYIYLDNSYSMSNEVGTDLTAFDQAVAFINDLVEVYPQNTKFKLLTNDFDPSSDVVKSKDETKEKLAETDLSGISRSLSEINSRQKREILNNQPRKKDIYWITDFQRSTAGDIAQLSFDTASNFYLVPLTYQTPGNVFIDSIYLTNPFLLESEKNDLIISFRNNGQAAVENISLQLLINDKQVSNASISIPANGSYDQSFELNQRLERINRGKISFEDFPVTFDNDFYFTLNVDDRVSILEIRSAEANENISKVYANQNLFSFQSFPEENLEYNAIENADLVVLNELDNISDALVEALLGFLEQDGTLAIVPGSQFDFTSYSRLFPVRNQASNVAPEKSALKTPDLSNPFFANMFIDSDEIFEMPLGVAGISTLAPSESILSFKNRNSFLTRMVGDKNIFLFATAFKEDYTTFHQHAVFVPIMYRIASLSNILSDDLYYTLDQSILKLSVDSIKKNVIFKLKNEDQELIPAQRILGRDVVMELPKNTMNTGYYNVLAEEETKKVLSFNFNPDESIMAQYSLSELQERFGGYDNVNVYEADNKNDFTNTLKELHSGVPLWKYMLIVSLLALLAEILIIRYL